MARNELMMRAPMRGEQMAAAPQQEQPPMNPLMQRRGGDVPEPPSRGDPLQDFMAKAQAAGIDIQGEMSKGADQNAVLDKAMRAIWAREPTDENGEMLEELSRHLGIPPPWTQGEGMMKLGGPQEGEPGRMPRASYEQMSPEERGFANPELARQYDYMTEARENEEPGAERAYGGMHNSLRRYHDSRQRMHK